jgi:hypothetical protein
MGLLTGSASVTRCTVTSRPEEIGFASLPFEEIVPGATLRERVGFLPFEPGAEYQIGQRRWAFRVRIDVLRPDPTRVQERLKQLVRTHQDETGDPFVSTRVRRELRQLAEEELLLSASPRSRVIECCLDDTTLWIGTTAKAHLGTVLGLLYQVGVVADFRTPWLDHGDTSPASDVLEAAEPWQSMLGCRFLRRLLEDVDIMVEPESGAVRLTTREARVSLTGAVVNDLLHYVERGAVLLSAKLVAGAAAFRFDALNYRLSGIRVETELHEHWQDLLDERLEKIDAIHELLDRKYAALRRRLTG